MQIYFHAELEILLRAGRHDAVEDEYGVDCSGRGKEGREGVGIAEIGLDTLRVLGMGRGGSRRRDDIGEDEFIFWGGGMAGEEVRGEELSDEARGAGYEDCRHGDDEWMDG